MAAPKRPHYFNSQFLIVRDFQDEQAYHDELLRRHNRLMHGWGVAHGLEVKKADDNVNYVIEPGSAIDSEGREIILDTRRTMNTTEVQIARQAAGASQDILVTIAFQEDDSSAAEDKYPGGAQNVTRKVQAPLVVATKSAAEDGKVIILAKISVNNVINNLVRRMASSVIAPGSHLSDISLDGTLSFTAKPPNATLPQVGLDYDSTSNQFRIRTWSQNAGILDTTHLSIKRDTGNVGIGTPDAPSQKLEVYGVLKLSANPNPNNDNRGVYFWNQDKIGPTIAGFGFEVRTGGNTPRFKISSTGNVGIGTPGSATTKLEVIGNNTALPATTGSTQSTGQIARLKSSATSDTVLDIGAGEKSFWLQSTEQSNLATNNSLLLNPNGGNVGIGITGALQHKLEVMGALKLGGTPVVTPDHTAAYFWNQQDIGPTIGGFGFEVRTGSDTPRLKINSAGNIGIFGNVRIGDNVTGAMEPATRLHVVGTGNASPAITGTVQSAGHVVRLRGTTNAGTVSPVLDIGSGGDKGFWIQSTNPADLTKNYPLFLNPNGGTVRIGPSGQPEAMFDVGDPSKDKMKSILARLQEGNAHLGIKSYDVQPKYAKSFALEHHFHNKLNSAINFARGDGETGGFITFAVNNGTDQMMLNQYGLELEGNLTVKGKISCGGKIAIFSPYFQRYISARGSGTQAVTTEAEVPKYQEEFTIQMSCSREFKENISDLTALEAMTTLQNLTPVKYDYKGDKTFRQNLGFIAEDMPDILASHDRKTISPFEVVPVLTRVAKEQQRIIAELQERVRTLQSNATKKHKEAQKGTTRWKSNYRSDSKN
jgi:hypothetical protein